MATIKRKNPTKKHSFKLPGLSTIMFTLVFVYILIQVITFVDNEDPITFTVEKSTYDTDFTAVGIAIRDETVLNASSSGTAYYYVRDGEKVSKGANIYSIGSQTAVQSSDTASSDSDELFTDIDYTEFIKQIKMFKTGFSESNFGDVYDFKTSMDNKLLEMYEEKALKQVGYSDASVGAEKAPFSGLVTYYEDGYESITRNDLSAELFDRTTYTKTSLRSESQISAGDVVCKLVNDETWEIAIMLSKDEYDKVSKNEYATYTINDSSRVINTPYETIDKDDRYYIIVSFNKYMAQYINERFLDINFQFSESTGLKIPVSSVITKDAYMVPKTFLVEEKDENNTVTNSYFYKVITKDNGDVEYSKITPLIYFSDDKFCYVDSSDVDADALLGKPDSTARFSVTTAARYSMNGVLCVTTGTAKFRRIEVRVEGDDYLIVSEETAYGISRYDRILLDGHSMNEGDAVY